MLHNSGPYGPNDAPINMGTPVNMSQMNPMNIGHNLNHLGKLTQEPPQVPSAHYNIPNYPPLNQSPMPLGQQMSPFPTFNSYPIQSSYIPHNAPSIHDNSWSNGALHHNLHPQATHSQSMMNYSTNLEKLSHNPVLSEFKEPHLPKVMPITIPQPKTFQKHERDSNCDMYSLNHDTFNQYASPNIGNPVERPLMDDTRRRSLENTVRLIENILINTTKNQEAQRVRETRNNEIENPKKSFDIPALLQKKSQQNMDYSKEETTTKDTERNINVSDNIRTEHQNDNGSQYYYRQSEPIQNLTELTEDQSSSASESTNVSQELEEDVKPEVETEKVFVNVEMEYDKVDVKLEPLYITDADYMNPFHRDINGVTREDVTSRIVDSESSVNEAIVIIKSESTSDAHYECPHCNLLFANPKRFLVHTKWHSFGLTNEKRMEILKEREMLRSQRREARVLDRMNSKEVVGEDTGDKTYSCKDCDKSFKTKGSLKNHRQRAHPTRSRECKLCGKTVFGWMALRTHLASHTDASGYQCSECPKRFKHAHSLAKHKDIHLEKTVSCDQCPKMFGSIAQMKLHQKCHERAQRGTTYRCSYCGKGFYEAYNLSVHERTHRNERPFVCQFCNTGFGTNSGLKRHIKVSHSASKPFKCATCQRSFVSAAIRERHAARHHAPGALPHGCGDCGSRYLKLRDLQKHMYKAHSKGKRKKKENSDSE